MPYLDSILTPVPKTKLDEYRALAGLCDTLWREHGALSYQEWIEDDVQPGKLTSFPQALQLREDEAVVIAFITYESREQRDAVLAKVMADARFTGMQHENMPFDTRRMFWGSFKPLMPA